LFKQQSNFETTAPAKTRVVSSSVTISPDQNRFVSNLQIYELCTLKPRANACSCFFYGAIAKLQKFLIAALISGPEFALVDALLRSV
jgi:hypothetical protein